MEHGKEAQLAVDSITSFTYEPIRFMSYAGFVVALVGKPSSGWSLLMIVLLLVGGLQMLMMAHNLVRESTGFVGVELDPGSRPMGNGRPSAMNQTGSAS